MKNFDETRATAEQGGVNPPTGLWKSDYKFVDAPSDGTPILQIFLPSLERRRVYLFLEAKLATANNDYVIGGELEFLRGGSSRARLPVQIGEDTNLNFIDQPTVNFFPSLKNTPGSANTIQVTLSKSFAGGTVSESSVLLHPYELDVAADECIFRVAFSREKNQTAKPKIRAWLGVLSMTPA